jgi:hypothetical protein
MRNIITKRLDSIEGIDNRFYALFLTILVAMLLHLCACEYEEVPQQSESLIEADEVNTLQTALIGSEDTASGYFRDFDFFSLRGIGPIAKSRMEYPYAEVRFRRDSVLVTKWTDDRYNRTFNIRIIGNQGIFIKKSDEKEITGVSWLDVFFTTENYLAKFRYTGSIWAPHHWELRSVEAIYPGPIVVYASASHPKNQRTSTFFIPDEKTLSMLSITRYLSDGNKIIEQSKPLRPDGLFGKQIFELYEGNFAKVPKSIFWLYFDLSRISH